MQVTIYGSRFSPFVEKVVRGVQRKGLGFELVVPRRRGDMRTWNPSTGKMPAADLAGERLFDSTHILRRLDALVPTPALVSPDPRAAAQQRLLEDWADESLHWCLRAFRWSPKNGAGLAARLIEEIGAPAPFGRSSRARCGARCARRCGRTGRGDYPSPCSRRSSTSGSTTCCAMLGDREFFFGDEPSVADLAVFGQLRYADDDTSPETRDALQARAALVLYMKRVDQATTARATR